MSLSADEHTALAKLLADFSGVTLERVEQLTGGASRETFEVEVSSSNPNQPGRYILQRESGELRRPNGLADEAILVDAAGRAGVPTPQVVVSNNHTSEENRLGQSFVISQAVPGETIARRILREPRFEQPRNRLTPQLGRALGLLHSKVDSQSIPWLETIDQLDYYQTIIDEIGIVSPSFELGLDWLKRHREPASEQVVVHGDFRLGNFIVDDDGLAAVIDWELAHLGDPMEDLGWLCVRAWRFGGDMPVAGLGSREELMAAYSDVVGHPVDPVALHWWEVMGTLKWGVMCAIQAERHLQGDQRSIELVTIGPRLAEQEYDLLRLIGTSDHSSSRTKDRTETDPRSSSELEEQAFNLSTGAGEGGGRPTSGELLEAVEEFLRADVTSAADRRVSFHARVAANAVAIARRDLRSSANTQTQNQSELGSLGYRSERSLAQAIRAGATAADSDHGVQAWGYCFASVVRRLQVNNPKWLDE